MTPVWLFNLTLTLLSVVNGRLWPPREVTLEQLTEPEIHSEGTHWDSQQQVLFYVDIQSQLVNRYDPATGELTQTKVDGGAVTLVVPILGQNDKFIIGRGRDLVILTWDGRNDSAITTEVLLTVDEANPKNRFNDGKADRSGRLFAGTMGYEDDQGNLDHKKGSFYRFAQDEPLETLLTEVDISNGLAWTADNSLMYYIDTGTKRVDVFDFDILTGNLSNRRTAFDFAANNISGSPDGMTIDRDDNLWIACFGGSQVVHVDPIAQKLLSSIPLPAQQVTDVAFGGPSLDELYISTSRLRLTDQEIEKQPLAGAVFRASGLGVRGHPGQSFIYNTRHSYGSPYWDYA